MDTTTDRNGYVRWIANGLQLVGYFLLIHEGFMVGLIIKGISDVLIMFWGYRNKLWDVVAVTGVFCVMNLQRAYEVAQWNVLQQHLHQLLQVLQNLT